MSLYQKFIESASPGKHQLQHQHLHQHHTHHHKHQHYQHQNHTNQLSQQSQMGKTQVSRSPNMRSNMTSSTPISKQQYRRLVEAAELNQQQQQQQFCRKSCKHPTCRAPDCRIDHEHLDSYFKTDDPVLLKWLQAMRFETELECMTTLQARTLATDEYSAGALSVRNSQVLIQRMRSDSNFILDFIDYLIECLPLKFSSLEKFNIEFSELWTRLINQTAPQITSQSQNSMMVNKTTASQTNNNLTIINCTPRKQHNQMNARNLKPLDDLANQLRALCIDYANLLQEYQINGIMSNIDNGRLESSLRKLKELYGKFIEISIRAELANIVRALQYDFSQASLNRLSSSSSLLPTRPFESSNAQLPLKWALIALWQLTKDDSYLCRTLTKNWQLSEQPKQNSPVASRVAKRLDYSTKYEPSAEPTRANSNHSATNSDSENYHPLRSDYQKLYQICNQQHRQTSANRHQFGQQHQQQVANSGTDDGGRPAGALSSALKSKQQQPVRQVSTIELLIAIIISQPNKHERLDMTNFIHSQAQHDKLIDLDEWDQSVSAAIYTSNQYKVAALRILNHLCINEQAVKTILKCFSTPPPSQGQPIPENKIIRSIFECYQTSQEHIYQNETMFHATKQGGSRKRSRRQTQQLDDEEYSDYGSRQTTSQRTGSSLGASDDGYGGEESDDVVVKEAIRLLVQLTTPFHKSNQGLDYYTLIGRFSIESLVKYLTNIVKSTSSREMLFLSLTALANISFITTEPMKIYGTNRVMMEMFRASKSRSKDLEIRDQAVTILANTADKNLLDIVSNGGLTFLLSCLESCPTRMANYKQLMDRLRSDPIGGDDDINRLNIENKPRVRKPIDFSENFPDALDCACDQQQTQLRLANPSSLVQTPSLCISRLSIGDLAAMERIHQKTAVAFARMSADPSTTRMILKYGGIKQMIDLCKFSHKRNHSDTVLIACIAALRKMAKVIENETFRYYNALDLIELDLNQALEIYGSSHDPRQQQLDRSTNLFASDV